MGTLSIGAPLDIVQEKSCDCRRRESIEGKVSPIGPPEPPPREIVGRINIVREIQTATLVECVKYTDDLKYIAAGLQDGPILLFDSDSSTILLDSQVVDSNEACTDIKFQKIPPEGCQRWIWATYGSGLIKCWDTVACRSVYSMKEDRHINKLNFHPSETKFLTVGDDKKIYIYDWLTKINERRLSCSEKIGSTDGHTASVTCAEFHPFNNFELISGGLDGTIQYWDVRAPTSQRTNRGILVVGDGIDFSTNGKEFLTCSLEDEPNIKIWDYSSGKMIRKIIPDPVHNQLICGKWVNNNNLILTGGGDLNTFRMINYKTGRTTGIITQLPGPVVDLDIMKLNHKVKPIRGQVKVNLTRPRMVFASENKIIEVEER